MEGRKRPRFADKSCCQRLIHPHQLRHALALGHVLDGEAVGQHYGPVVHLVGFPQLRGHGGFIVEVGKAAVRVERPSVKDSLGGLLDLLSVKFHEAVHKRNNFINPFGTMPSSLCKSIKFYAYPFFIASFIKQFQKAYPPPGFNTCK